MNNVDSDIKDESKRKPVGSKVKVSVKEASSKMQTKQEIYNFLIYDCGRYLCDSDSLTTYFMKDIITGKRKGMFSMFSVITYL